MSSLLLKNVILDGSRKDVFVADGFFREIADCISLPAAEVIDAGGALSIHPPFYNAHTHAAMTLLRGYADDFELFRWLSEYIWPAEARMTEEAVYHGTRLAILEMIHSGTVFFNDMYWHQRAALRAAEEMGVRACIGMLQLSNPDPAMRGKLDNEWLWERRAQLPSRIQLAYAPHAIYTVSGEVLRRTAELARENNAWIHIHLAETEKEFSDSRKEHGMTPTEYLDSLGLLTERTLCAHAVWMTDSDLDRIASRASVLVHMPVSNMKLGSGAFPYERARKAGCRLALGTDGVSSNNNLSMLEEMKFAALLAKYGASSPEVLPADAVFHMATAAGADAFAIPAGKIEAGLEADCMLVRRDNVRMVPDHHSISNLVYSADSSCVDTVLCQGRILMRSGRIPGEEEIIEEARRAAATLALK